MTKPSIQVEQANAALYTADVALAAYNDELNAILNKQIVDVHQEFPVIMRVKGLVEKCNALIALLEKKENEIVTIQRIRENEKI